ncbi:MAG TPA: TonB-dependent siderophore receptor [Bryobacteraceae bacterium]|nr:TonB-dependent siderophore receptor [Bryobacteraceae bacterium]
MKVKKLKKASIPGTGRQWVAVGALAAACTVSGTVPAVLGAQQAGPQPGDSGQTLPVMRFGIVAGPLADALEEFQKTAGWRVTLRESAMGTLPSKGVSGQMPAPQALRQLLAGTGLAFRMTGPAEAVVEFEQSRSMIDVVDQAPLPSPRYTEPLRDLPQTITVIPRDVIAQQGATSLTDVLRNVPGLTIAAGEGGTPAGDNLTLRGNSARNDIFVDGVRDLNPQTRDPFNLEQVEVTKGPTSAVSGRGSAGGTINLTSKAPSVRKILGGSVALGNADTRRFTVDLNTPLQKLGLGERSAFRLNLLKHDAHVPGRDAVKNDRWGIAPSIGFGLGTPTRLTLSYYKLRQDNISDYGIPWVPATNNALAAYRDRPAPVPRDTFYGFRDRDREVLNQDTGTVRFEHDFSDDLQLRSQLRHGLAGRNSIATPPRFASNDSTVINREMRAWLAKDRITDSQTDVTAHFKTGGIRHSVVTGAAFTNERNTRINRSASNSPTTLLNPNPDDVYTGLITTSPNVGKITGNTQAVWVFDTAKFGEHWEATGGVRWERFNVDGVSTAPAPVDQDVNMASVRAGIIYKPVQAGSFYVSYGSSLSPSLEGLSYNTSNTSIPPEKTYSTEAGAKWEVAGNRLLLSGALFRVAKDNARTPGLLETDPPQVLAGRQISQGLELAASGAITSSLRILGAYTFIDARIRSSNTPTEVGRYFQNTPRNSASVWVTYTAKRLTLGVGPRFMGRRFGNNINTRRVGSYATLDTMASLRVTEYLDLRLNVSNLNNEYYFERLGGGHVVPGPSRYVLFTTNFHF